MGKEVIAKYPHSANLFQFCRRVLDYKYGGARVIDQDVGQILGFDPADCSHWKKGKKQVKSIHAIKLIAQHLAVDERLIADVAFGDLDDQEAYLEVSGYGAFNINARFIEDAKKDLYRKGAVWDKGKETDVLAHFQANLQKVTEIVKNIHLKINFSEAPLYIPEILQHFSQIKIVPLPESESNKLVSSEISDQGILTLKVKEGMETRPYVRFMMAKMIGSYFIGQNQDSFASETTDKLREHMRDVEANSFAVKLLTPAFMVRRDLKKSTQNTDVVTELSELFWVSKSFMNRRIKELLIDPSEY